MNDDNPIEELRDAALLIVVAMIGVVAIIATVSVFLWRGLS